MKFDNTRTFVYEKCVERVEKRRKEKNVPMYTICPDDKSLVSHFFNNNPTPKNPYLVNKRLLKNEDDDTGILPILKFDKEHEVLWGEPTEFENNLYPIFERMIFDLMSFDSKYKSDIELVLCDHITYAKYSTIAKLKEEYHLSSTLTYFGILDIFISDENMKIYLRNAIRNLYAKPRFSDLFMKEFLIFTHKHKDYKFFDKRLEQEFIIPSLIPLIRKYVPNSSSLGLRVKQLLETDIVKCINQFELQAKNQEHSVEYSMNLKIIHASCDYIVQLEKI